eukprot:jgi/Astpho2/4432/fgenesh1_pg.00067_%23_33_t
MPTTESDLHEPDLPIELGEVVTARLGGTAAAARILTGWTKKVAGDRRLAHLAAGYRANPELHRRRQTSLVQFSVGGPQVIAAEELVRLEDLAAKTDNTVLSGDTISCLQTYLIEHAERPQHYPDAASLQWTDLKTVAGPKARLQKELAQDLQQAYAAMQMERKQQLRQLFLREQQQWDTELAAQGLALAKVRD